MKNTKQAIALASAAALSVGMLAGCGGAASSAATASSESNSTATAEASTTAASDGTLVLAETGFESKFSPFFAASASDQDVIDLTQIALLGADRKGEMVLNGIEGETREYNGTDYTYHGPADCVVTENADGTVTYDIKLREDLKFSDGEPVTIDDVIFSMYVFLDPTYDGSATMYSTPIVGLDEYRNSMTTLSKLIAEAGEDNTDNTKFTAEQQKAFWDAVNDGGVKFAQEIINKNRNGLEVVKALAKGGFPDVAQDMLNIQKAKLTGDYLHTSAIIVGEGQVLSAVNDVNDYAGPATGYRLQGERWEEIKNIPGALDPNELG